VKASGGRWLAQGDVQVVEGAWPDSVVLIEFPTHAEAQNWYGSPEHEKIRPLRVNNAISALILVDHVAPGFTVAGFAQQVRAAIAAGTGAGS
jgi:uncharacterized protein (DUF1330 family)